MAERRGRASTIGRVAALLVVLATVAASCDGDEGQTLGTDATSVSVTAASTAVTPVPAAQVTAAPQGDVPVTAPATQPRPAPAATTVAPPAPPTPTPADGPVCSTETALLPADGEPVRVIFDTDFASDVDDVGALAVLHALADAGEVEILAVMVSDGSDEPAHRAIDAINTYYGRPDIPIGVVTGAAPVRPSAYVAAIATQFPNDIGDPLPATDLYREILAKQGDGAVTIVSVGYLTNLEALLSSSPDERSPLPGTDLVRAKVRRWVAMGGHYPDSAAHPFAAEFNFVEDATAALNVVSAWPTPAVFSGFEIGVTVLTGAALQTGTPADNPVRESYRIFNGGADHASWDLTAVLAAVRGTAGVFDACTGLNVIGPGGSNTWQDAVGGPHAYLRLTVPPDTVAALLDELLVAPPARP